MNIKEKLNPIKTARIAGFLYIPPWILSLVAIFLHQDLIVPGDVATTANNIVASIGIHTQHCDGPNRPGGLYIPGSGFIPVAQTRKQKSGSADGHSLSGQCSDRDAQRNKPLCGPAAIEWC